MKALLLLALLSGCAAFDQTVTLYAPARMCLGMCAHLRPAVDDLDSADMTARICAAGAITKACQK